MKRVLGTIFSDIILYFVRETLSLKCNSFDAIDAEHVTSIILQ